MATIRRPSIMERMDQVRANTVSDREFEELWGVTMDEHIERMMAHVKAFDAKQQQRKVAGRRK